MVNFSTWFRRNVLIRFNLLLLIGIFFLIFLWINLEQKKIQTLEQKLDYIASIADQSIQRKDRTLLENIAYYSLKDTQSKSFFLCSKEEVLYYLSDSFIQCNKIREQNSLLTNVSFRILKSSPDTTLFVISDRSIFIKEAIVILVFVIIYLVMSFNQLRFINRKIKEDIILPLGQINFNKPTSIYEINETLIQREKIKTIEIEHKIFESTQRQAKQLSHDIRSPLAALKVVKELGSSGLDPDVGKLLSSSIDRITDIANTILPKKNEPSSGLKNNLAEQSFVWMLIDQIISEKRVEYKNADNVSIQLHINGSPFGMNALCHEVELMRAVSNIINNSIEARNQNKPIQIDVQLQSDQDNVSLIISDNGHGMSQEVLAKAFDEGFTSGKKQGTGLGLYQVKQAIESWGGNIQIESQVELGTKITIQLKKSEKPKWLTDSIKIDTYDSIIVLDDEEYVFRIIQEKFGKYGLTIRYFKNIDDLESNLNVHSKTFYFIDQDLKQKTTGIDLIQRNNLQNQSVLLTGNYDDKQVQEKSTKLGIKILPKPLIHFVPIA